MKRIGIMGGTFDPVHKGHLLLGKQAYEEYNLDEIWYMPSHIPPHKKDRTITEEEARIEMLRLVIQDCSYFVLCFFVFLTLFSSCSPRGKDKVTIGSTAS